MTAKKNHARLGVFVLLAILLLAGLAISLGGGNTFRKKVTMETYFNESVQGLDIGSKVRYRGVVIGVVSSINFTYTRYELDVPPAERKQYVMVEMAVYPDLLGTSTASREFVNKLVADGLRIRMAPIGITGIAYMELDFSRNAPVLPITWEPDNLYIPSARSTVLSLFDTAESIMGRLATLDVAGIIQHLDELAVTLNRKVESVDTGKLAKDLEAVMKDLRKTLAGIDRITGSEELKPLPADLAATVHRLREIVDSPELKRTLASLDRSTQRVDRALDGHEQDIADTLANLRATTANLKALTENLRRDPAGTLLAAPPKPTDAYTTP